MTRDQLRQIIEGITEEQITSVLNINSADIGNAKKLTILLNRRMVSDRLSTF